MFTCFSAMFTMTPDLTAETTGEAVRCLDRRRFDLIVVDHKMPGMGGLAFLALAARAQPKAARFLITGWTEEVPRQQLRKLGIRTLIPKPWDNRQLKDALRGALAG